MTFAYCLRVSVMSVVWWVAFHNNVGTLVSPSDLSPLCIGLRAFLQTLRNQPGSEGRKSVERTPWGWGGASLEGVYLTSIYIPVARTSPLAPPSLGGGWESQSVCVPKTKKKQVE